jgi:hypothetical protein
LGHFSVDFRTADGGHPTRLVDDRHLAVGVIVKRSITERYEVILHFDVRHMGGCPLSRRLVGEHPLSTPRGRHLFA